MLCVCVTQNEISSCVVCDHRKSRDRSSDYLHSADGEYETANPTGPYDQPQYDVIQLGHSQHAPDAGHYDSLNPQTQGLEPQYDVISPPRGDNQLIAVDYADVYV